MELKKAKRDMIVQVKKNIDKSKDRFGTTSLKDKTPCMFGTVKYIGDYKGYVTIEVEFFEETSTFRSHYYAPEDLRIANRTSKKKRTLERLNNAYIRTIVESSNYTTKKKCLSDFLATADFWKWSGENADTVKIKRDWFDFSRIEPLQSACAYCHYLKCSNCSLEKDLGHCTDGSAYRDWRRLADIAPEDRSPSDMLWIKRTSVKIELHTRRFVEYLRKNLPKENI